MSSTVIGFYRKNGKTRPISSRNTYARVIVRSHNSEKFDDDQWKNETFAKALEWDEQGAYLRIKDENWLFKLLWAFPSEYSFINSHIVSEDQSTLFKIRQEIRNVWTLLTRNEVAKADESIMRQIHGEAI